MLQINEPFSDLHVTVALDESLSDVYASRLERSGYHLMLLHGAADISHLLSTQNVDAILLAAGAQSRLLAENLPVEYRQHLLLLLVPQDTEPIDPKILSLCGCSSTH